MRLKTFFDLLVFKTGASLRTEIAHYYVNYLWWVFTPLSSMLVYYLVFGTFLNRGTPNFVAFLLCGVTSWQWFASTVNNASGSILGGKGLMLQVNIPKVFFPLEVLLRDSFKHSFVLALLLIFLVFYPTPVTVAWLALPALLVVQFTVNAGIALLCASVVPFVPDFKIIIATCINLAFFGSGIFFSIDQVILPKHRHIIYLNPMAGLIKNYRQVLLHGQWPDWSYLGYSLAVGVVLSIIGAWVIFSFDHVYPKACQK